MASGIVSLDLHERGSETASRVVLAQRPPGLRTPAVVLWASALAWLVALLAGELANPRRGGVPERWSTAFPVGMYAAMTFAVARLHGLHWAEPFARGWTVVAAIVWALVLNRAVRAAARQSPRGPARAARRRRPPARAPAAPARAACAPRRRRGGG